MKDCKSLNRDVTETLTVYKINAVFEENDVRLEGGRMLGAWRVVRRNIKAQATKRE